MFKYFLIIFIVALVLSPLAWLKSTPGQRRATEYRKRAMSLGLRVQLVPAVDADEGDKRPSEVRYVLPPVQGSSPPADWVLFRSTRRGWESPWDGWRWLRGEADSATCEIIAQLLPDLPSSAIALTSSREGVAVYWRERGELEDVDGISSVLVTLRSAVNRIS